MIQSIPGTRTMLPKPKIKYFVFKKNVWVKEEVLMKMKQLLQGLKTFMNNTLINMLLLNNKYIYTTWFIIEIIFVLRMRHLFLGLFHTFLFLTIHDKKTLIF